ncbi:MAG: hypothetical protein HQ570_00705 [Candidatus Omnitrophica bacterium]|nr:hypothetical protein [Candidatus Omnitrophota bacterium]
MKKSEKKKSFFGRLIEKLDKKIEEKAKTKPCCDSKNKNKGKSCCSG